MGTSGIYIPANFETAAHSFAFIKKGHSHSIMTSKYWESSPKCSFCEFCFYLSNQILQNKQNPFYGQEYFQYILYKDSLDRWFHGSMKMINNG